MAYNNDVKIRDFFFEAHLGLKENCSDDREREKGK